MENAAVNFSVQIPVQIPYFTYLKAVCVCVCVCVSVSVSVYEIDGI